MKESLLAVTVVSATCSALVDGIEVYGIAQWPCAEHLNQRRKANDSYDQVIINFLTGYVTAYNVGHPERQ